MKNIFLLLLVISFFSCRTVKKSWVNENFTSKTDASAIEESLQASHLALQSELQETITSQFKQNSKEETETTSQNETTNISGTITAEDGKKKSVTIGDTTIESDGANISFNTTSNSSRELTTKYQELTKELEYQKQLNQNIQQDFAALEKKVTQNTTSIKSEANKSTRDVKKSGFTFGTWLIIGIVLIAVLVIWYFRKSIPFLK